MQKKINKKIFLLNTSDFRLQRAFTLVELLVVISIIGLLTTGLLVGSKKPQRATALHRAAREVLLVLRDAQNHSLVVGVDEGSSAPCGFGIHHENGNEESFIFFKEETLPQGQNCVATTTGQTIDRLYQATSGYGSDTVIETISLAESYLVKIDSDFSDIYFEPPDGLTYFNGVHDNQIASSSDIVLCLREDCANFRKTVRVYLGGNIEIVD